MSQQFKTYVVWPGDEAAEAKFWMMATGLEPGQLWRFLEQQRAERPVHQLL